MKNRRLGRTAFQGWVGGDGAAVATATLNTYSIVLWKLCGSYQSCILILSARRS